MADEIFTDAPEVEEMAQSYIDRYHKHLQGDDIRIVYLFSTQERETNGKCVLGEASKVSGRNAAIAATDDENWIPLTFVCRMCLNWHTEVEGWTCTAGDTDYTVCVHCREKYAGLERDPVPNKLIARLNAGAPTADAKEAVGPPKRKAFFIMTIYLPYWDRMDRAKREALVDHELCHFGVTWKENGEVKLWIKPHDLEEFNDVVKRHGLWKGDVEALVRAAQPFAMQMDLGFDAAEETEDVFAAKPGGATENESTAI